MRSVLLCVRGAPPTRGRRRPPDSIPLAKGSGPRFASRRKPRPSGENPAADLRHRDKHRLDRRSETSVDFTDQEDSPLRRALPLGLLVAVALPASALADTFDAAGKGKLPLTVGINSTWVIVAAMVVMFMQAGFAFLEIGFSRGKNAGTVVAKILTNFSIAGIMYWAIGFAFAFGSGDLIGHTGWFLQDFGDPQKAFPIMGLSDATIEAKWFFQFVFCAVSLAIVWGTTLERIKFGVYIIYAVVFAGFIYPVASHWVFGGGWLQSNLGMQDFAGSTAVHLIGATGALAVLLLLGARRGKYGTDGKPRARPGPKQPRLAPGAFIPCVGG